MSREAIMGYMRRAYGAERMVLVAAGNVEHAAVVGLAERLFGGLAREGGAGPRPADYRGGERRATRDPEQAHLLPGFPGIAYPDADFYADSEMSTLFGSGMSSRLFQEIRARLELVYSIYATNGSEEP